MITFDQFDTEPTMFYSGSSTDTIVHGNILSVDAATFLRKRGVIAGKKTGLTAYFFGKKWLYSDWLSHVSGAASRGNSRLQRAETAGEFFLDSFAPKIIDVYGQFTGDSYRILDGGMSGSVEFDIKAISGEVAGGTGGALGIQIDIGNGSDIPSTVGWNVAFPFESNRNLRFLPRQLFPNTILTTPVLATQDLQQNDLDPPGTSSVNIGAIVYGGVDSHRAHYVVTLPLHPTASIGDQVFKRWESTAISTTVLQKSFFGIGNGFMPNLEGYSGGGSELTGKYSKLGRNLPTYEDLSIGGLYGILDGIAGGAGPATLYNPILRGYKYGLISAMPKRFSVVFRGNRWGMPRDMLEQRPYTATLIRVADVSIDYPITIRFVSGSGAHINSIDYLTASNPSYNPTDSGIYDGHYRSGQPFSDTR